MFTFLVPQVLCNVYMPFGSSCAEPPGLRLSRSSGHNLPPAALIGSVRRVRPPARASPDRAAHLPSHVCATAFPPVCHLLPISCPARRVDELNTENAFMDLGMDLILVQPEPNPTHCHHFQVNNFALLSNSPHLSTLLT